MVDFQRLIARPGIGFMKSASSESIIAEDLTVSIFASGDVVEITSIFPDRKRLNAVIDLRIAAASPLIE
jgi:hypothetical protein